MSFPLYFIQVSASLPKEELVDKVKTQLTKEE